MDTERTMGLPRGDRSKVSYRSPKALTRYQGLHGSAMHFSFKHGVCNHKELKMSDVYQMLSYSPGRKGFPLYTAQQVAQWPRVSWLVDGVIQKQSSAVIYGESRIGKSFLALDLAYKLASGSDWFGYHVQPSKVIFFAAESPAGLPDRLDAMKTHQGQDAPDNICFLRTQIELSDPAHIQKIIDTVDGFDVLFIDTFNAAASETDENSAKEMGTILKGIRRIIDETRCTVIFVHHCGWSDHDRLRGHSSFSAAMDTRILVTRDAGHPSWKVKGQREGADTEAHRYELRQVILPSGTSCVVEPLNTTPAVKVVAQPRSANQKIVYQTAMKLLLEAQGLPLQLETLVSQSAKQIDADSRHQRQRAEEAADGLRKAGFIQVDESGYVSLRC